MTSQFITRADSMVAFFLNTMVGNCLGHKLMAENYLRESGLNYTIVRPGGLKGEKMDQLSNENSMPDEQPNILQGDNGKGYIHRHTVGKLIVNELINNSDLPPKFTFEVVARTDKEKEKDENF